MEHPSKEQILEIAKQSEENKILMQQLYPSLFVVENWREEINKENPHSYYYIGAVSEKNFEPSFNHRNSDNSRKPEYTFSKMQDANLVIKHFNLMQSMLAFAHVKNNGVVVDWEDTQQSKFGLVQNSHNKIEVEDVFLHQTNCFIYGIAVLNEEHAEQMLNEFGDQIKEIYGKQY